MNVDTKKAYQTFLFIPNLIDYGRLLCLILSCYYALTRPGIVLILYSLNQWLDAFDGMAARKFNQCNAFGMVLDMVLDRASDAVFLAIIAMSYPEYSFFFLVAIIIDLVSHWYQTFSTQYCGETHHKTAKTEWKLIELYYRKWFLFTCVLGYETFLLNLYVKRFEHTLNVPDQLKILNTLMMVFTAPIFILKNVISVIQLISASQKICVREQELKLLEVKSKQK